MGYAWLVYTSNGWIAYVTYGRYANATHGWYAYATYGWYANGWSTHANGRPTYANGRPTNGTYGWTTDVNGRLTIYDAWTIATKSLWWSTSIWLIVPKLIIRMPIWQTILTNESH